MKKKGLFKRIAVSIAAAVMAVGMMPAGIISEVVKAEVERPKVTSITIVDAKETYKGGDELTIKIEADTKDSVGLQYIYILYSNNAATGQNTSWKLYARARAATGSTVSQVTLKIPEHQPSGTYDLYGLSLNDKNGTSNMGKYENVTSSIVISNDANQDITSPELTGISFGKTEVSEYEDLKYTVTATDANSVSKTYVTFYNVLTGEINTGRWTDSPKTGGISTIPDTIYESSGTAQITDNKNGTVVFNEPGIYKIYKVEVSDSLGNGTAFYNPEKTNNDTKKLESLKDFTIVVKEGKNNIVKAGEAKYASGLKSSGTYKIGETITFTMSRNDYNNKYSCPCLLKKDVNGKLDKKGPVLYAPSYSFDTSKLEPGVYYLSTVDNEYIEINIVDGDMTIGESNDSSSEDSSDDSSDSDTSSDTTDATSTRNPVTSSTGTAAVENKVTTSASGEATATIKLPANDKVANLDVNTLDAQAKAVLDQAFSFDVKAGNGVIPSGASMKISKVVTGTEYSNAKAVTNAVSDKIAVFEIDLLNSNDVKVQPNGKVSITTDIPTGFDPSRVVVYRLSADGKSYTKLTSTVSGGKISFETDHFSTYIVAQESVTKVTDKAPVTADKAPLALLAFVLLSAGATLVAGTVRKYAK